MRKLIALAWNDFRLQFTERSEIVFFLILPVLFTAILAASMGGSNDPTDSRYMVLVVDQDESDLSAQLIANLTASTVVKPAVTSAADAERQFDQKNSGIPALLTIPSGFGAALLQGQQADLDVKHAPNDNRVLYVDQAVRSAGVQVSNAVAAARASVAEAARLRPFASATAEQAYTQQALGLVQQQLKTPPAKIVVTQSARAVSQSITAAEQASAGQLVTWALITLIGAAAVFVDERLGGTLRRLVITPTRSATILGGKVTGKLAAGILQMILLVGFGALVFHVPWGRSPAALAAMMLSFGLAAVAFGVLLGTFAKTRSQAGGLTVMFSMLMAALGGCWWPLEVTPPLYQTVVKILPTTWAMQGFQAVLVRGADLTSVLPYAAVLLVFAAVYFVIGIRRFKWE